MPKVSKSRAELLPKFRNPNLRNATFSKPFVIQYQLSSNLTELARYRYARASSIADPKGLLRTREEVLTYGCGVSPAVDHRDQPHLGGVIFGSSRSRNVSASNVVSYSVLIVSYSVVKI